MAFLSRLLILSGIFLLGVTLFLWYPYLEYDSSPLVDKVDRIVVKKDQRILTVYAKGKKLKTYRVVLGRAPIGHKLEKGDRKTPEGIYYVVSKNPNSQFHLSLKISYPNKADRLEAAKHGRHPGDDIMIHGLSKKLSFVGGFHRVKDWTLGCIAVTNSEIEQIYAATPVGTRVEILP
jgi:murein L,D-transpeptidase YafK